MGRKLAGGTMPNCPRYNRSLRAIVPPASRPNRSKIHAEIYYLYYYACTREKERYVNALVARKGEGADPPSLVEARIARKMYGNISRFV